MNIVRIEKSCGTVLHLQLFHSNMFMVIRFWDIMDVTCIIGYFQKFLSFKKATTQPYGVNEYQISQVAQKWSSTSQICEYWSTCSQPYVSHIFHFQEMNYLYKVVSTCWTIQQAIYFRISSEFLKKRTFSNWICFFAERNSLHFYGVNTKYLHYIRLSLKIWA